MKIRTVGADLLQPMVPAGLHGRESGMGFDNGAGEVPVPYEDLWKPGGRS